MSNRLCVCMLYYCIIDICHFTSDILNYSYLVYSNILLALCNIKRVKCKVEILNKNNIPSILSEMDRK